MECEVARLERARGTANRKASAAADELRAALREANREVARLQRGVQTLANNSGPNRDERWADEDLHFVATDLVNGGPGVGPRV